MPVDVPIYTGLTDLVAIGLAESLLREAGIPYVGAREESENLLCWWNVRVPREFEAEAREILESVEHAK